ncbi:MAG: oxidoreductase [Actinobacteria bacterium HGW-Actinobacteria-4]|nr:MAG: oxidoreductase [Actinobacteria bacterium HGW-Actinobacteria-4]
MTTSTQTVQEARTKRSARRSWWVDGIEASVWIASAAAVALMIESGGLLTVSAIDYLYALGRAAGIVAAVLVMSQVLLISRSPWIERAIGHDRAALKHTRFGKIAFILMLVHVAFITLMSAYYDGKGALEQLLSFSDAGWFMLAAQVGFGIFALVVATSLYLVRSRWRYENWYAVHLSVYIAIAFVVPHQFMEGSTFRSGGLAWWFWFTLYAFAFGSLIVFRMIRPGVNLMRHDLRVSEVTVNPDGSTSVVMTGRNLDRLRARPGQFFLWRFLDKERGREAHPFSLSRQPDGKTLRITVKPSGDHSGSLAGLAIGTRVVADGPLGVFSDVSRTKPGLALFAAGIGITPIRAMLETHGADDGACTVVYRVRSAEEAPLLDEVQALAASSGAQLHVLTGGRGDGWAPAGHEGSLTDLIPDLTDRDVYICGPAVWAAVVEAEALAAGVPRESVHREQFAW